MRLLKLGQKQEQLLRAVKGLQLVDLPEAEQCCGFGGTFSVKNAEVSSAMLADKTSNIARTGASICAGGDYSCLMHIGGGLSRDNSEVATMHLAEILASTESEPININWPSGKDKKVVVK